MESDNLSPLTYGWLRPSMVSAMEKLVRITIPHKELYKLLLGCLVLEATSRRSDMGLGLLPICSVCRGSRPRNQKSSSNSRFQKKKTILFLGNLTYSM